MPSGIYKRKFLDLTGQKFGRLTVIKLAHKKDKKYLWLCKCECGNEKCISSSELRSGRTKSCRCLWRERVTKHGLTKTKFYKIWRSINDRCYYKKNVNIYKHYGERGITVCEQWKTFLNFRDDMYLSYKEHKLNNSYTSIDRINNNGNYCKENCRWATRKEQCNNTRNNHFLTYKGQTLTISQWAEKCKLNRYILYYRINKYKWSVEKTLTTPVKKRLIRR